MEATTISALLENVGHVVTESISWMGDVATAVTGNPLLLFGVVIGFAGIGIGLFKRIFRAV